jgi:hypothetical protein
MTVSISDTSEELMTRQQVAYLFRDTSATVAKWARRGLLPEVRNGAGRPRLSWRAERLAEYRGEHRISRGSRRKVTTPG